MSAPHRASAVTGAAAVAVFLGALSVLAASAWQGAARLARRRRKHRAWLRDFEAEARGRNGGER